MMPDLEPRPKSDADIGTSSLYDSQPIKNEIVAKRKRKSARAERREKLKALRELIQGESEPEIIAPESGRNGAA